MATDNSSVNLSNGTPDFKIARRQVSKSSLLGDKQTPNVTQTPSLARKPLPPIKGDSARVQAVPSSPVRIVVPSPQMHEPYSARYEADARPNTRFVDNQRPTASRQDSTSSARSSVRLVTDDSTSSRKPDAGFSAQSPSQLEIPIRTAHSRAVSAPLNAVDAQSGEWTEPMGPEGEEEPSQPLQYFHRPTRVSSRLPPGLEKPPKLDTETRRSSLPPTANVPMSAASLLSPDGWQPRRELARPQSTSNLSAASGPSSASRPHSRNSSGDFGGKERSVSANRKLEHRTSAIDLLNTSYSQQAAQTLALSNAQLRNQVGGSASLLHTRDTLAMYRTNVNKSNDFSARYEFALLLISAANEPVPQPDGTFVAAPDQEDLLKESRSILQRLADRGYPYAQYYLGDGYFTGLFNKGREDYEKAFHLFVAASKHGHAEAGYRAALCYEFGWGCRRDFNKAVQFYRQSASKGHPGAATRLGKACLTGDMGLVGKSREGVKWLKRATEAADQQHNSAPFELGLLHLTGFDPDVFKDPGYAAQLFTQAGELGHAEANMRMGEAYEHGLYTCPRDPALSLHFYNEAAQAGMPDAMMALCAWYMIGAEPVMEKDEFEAYEWAKRAADLGLAKAEYATGYFTEMGIGCRRDPLEANVWYVRAAEQGDNRAKQRLEIIRAASAGETALPALPGARGQKKKANTTIAKPRQQQQQQPAHPDEKDCTVM